MAGPIVHCLLRAFVGTQIMSMVIITRVPADIDGLSDEELNANNVKFEILFAIHLALVLVCR